MHRAPENWAGGNVPRDCCGVPGRDVELRGADAAAPFEGLAQPVLGFTTLAARNFASQALL